MVADANLFTRGESAGLTKKRTEVDTKSPGQR